MTIIPNIKYKLVKFRTHWFRTSPIISYFITFANFMMLIFLMVSDGNYYSLILVPTLVILLAIVYYTDDKKDIFGAELVYSSIRNPAFVEILCKLNRIDPKPVTEDEKKQIFKRYSMNKFNLKSLA